MKHIKILIAVAAAAVLTCCSSCGADAAPLPATTPPPAAITATPQPTDSPEALILVNRYSPIPADYGVELRKLENGQSVAAVCYDALDEMLSDCIAAGHEPVVCSGYRNVDLQTQLYENKVSRLMDSGYSRSKAERLAATEVAYPGTSEHHTGLAVDIIDAANSNLDESQEQMPAQQWLLQNCQNYGFILRYPKDKSTLTGIIYEPWHYRYVGKEAAAVICEQQLCLEEYLAQHSVW